MYTNINLHEETWTFGRRSIFHPLICLGIGQNWSKISLGVTFYTLQTVSLKIFITVWSLKIF